MIKKIIDKIHNSKSFLITAHMNLEGDALGSELATYLLLKKLKKKVIICNNDPTPRIYGFLPRANIIRNTLDDEVFDVAIVLDCSDSSRAGRVKDYLSRAKSIINIDHHISNTNFGDMNWVDPAASSVAQMIYKIASNLKIMDRRIAICLYTGIYTDTGNFTYANTKPETLNISAKLMSYNINPHDIYVKLHSSCQLEDLKFMGKVVSSLKFDISRRICWAPITRWREGNYDLTEVLFSIMRLLKGVEVFILFKKAGKNKIRVNFRSRSSVDVNRVAKFFGGGGHKRASGTTMEDTLESAQKKVITFVRRYTNGSRLRK
ncbi:MAG: bifunctional oligoribonuclease/PAP phosphatase NrnA [Candidatus Omnitrophota bacterium]